MPNYEYECGGCDHKFIELQTMSEDRLEKCPKCHKKKLERLISGGAAIVFKGSGFYETDYKKKKKADSPDSKDSSSKESPSKDSGTVSSEKGSAEKKKSPPSKKKASSKDPSKK